jgi:hypothetical protein
MRRSTCVSRAGRRVVERAAQKLARTDPVAPPLRDCRSVARCVEHAHALRVVTECKAMTLG